MKNRNVVLILIGIIIVTCGVGLLTLNFCRNNKVEVSDARVYGVVAMEDSVALNLN